MEGFLALLHGARTPDGLTAALDRAIEEDDLRRRRGMALAWMGGRA
ncbi:MAG TPA: hypothetical protein VHB98_21830 [Chloroflexota bacterium]|nr:hypothetical protein [Chloroflexota bacterium]